MYEICLICPVCGEYHFWDHDDGSIECDSCGWVGLTKDLQIQFFEV